MNIELEKIIAALVLNHDIRLDEAKIVVEANANDIIKDLESGRSIQAIADGLTDIHF